MLNKILGAFSIGSAFALVWIIIDSFFIKGIRPNEEVTTFDKPVLLIIIFGILVVLPIFLVLIDKSKSRIISEA
jgi:hypothetical protein